MPKATANVDRRRSGRGDNIRTSINAKSNLQDQRKKGIYAPGLASTSSASAEFTTGINVGKTMSAGKSIGKGATRPVPAVKKIGGK